MRSKINFTKIDQADLDSPRRELSNGGLGIVAALLVCWQINFLSAHNERPIQLCSPIRGWTKKTNFKHKTKQNQNGGKLQTQTNPSREKRFLSTPDLPRAVIIGPSPCYSPFRNYGSLPLPPPLRRPTFTVQHWPLQFQRRTAVHGREGDPRRRTCTRAFEFVLTIKMSLVAGARGRCQQPITSARRGTTRLLSCGPSMVSENR